MRRGTLIAAAILGCASACGAFGEATEGEPGPVPNAYAAADVDPNEAGGDGAPIITCTEEEKTTARHCGRCGRDCGEGLCVGGECQPYMLESGLVGSWYVTVDADYVYWSSRKDTTYGVTGAGKLFRRKKIGADVPVTLAGDDGIFDVAVAGSAVFFTSFGGNADGVFRTSVTPGTEPPQPVAGLSLELAAQPDKVYAATRGQAISLEVVGTTGTSSVLRAISDIGNATEGLASDGEYVYWANHVETGSIGRLKLADNTLSAVVNNTRQPRRVAVDDQFVYWTSDIEHTIRRARKDGSDVAPLPPLLAATVDVGFGRVIADATHLYATVDREGKVVRMDKDGKNPREIAKGLVHPIGLAQDETAIYYVECSDSGKLWRVAK